MLTKDFIRKSFPMILLLALSYTVTSQPILTIGEAFDFDIGDEFHIKTNIDIQPPSAVRLKVINQFFSSNNDTVYYQIARDGYGTVFHSTPEPHLEYTFAKDTVMKYYTNLESSVFSYYSHLQYEKFTNDDSSEFSYDSIVGNSTQYCDALINGFHCAIGSFEASSYTYKFGKGLGLVREYYVDGSAPDYPLTQRTLFYYKKQGIECGVPDTIQNIEEINADEEISIYPNPANQVLNIELLGQISATVRFFDANGKLCFTKNITEGECFDISSLASGVYFLNIQLTDKQISKRIVIQ